MNAGKLTFLLLNLFVPSQTYSGNLPVIQIICDAQTTEIVPSLREQLKSEFQVESVQAGNWEEIQDQARRLKRGKHILLFHTFIRARPEWVQDISGWKSKDIVWVKNSPFADDWPIPTIDLNGYLDKQKREVTVAQQAGFLAESIRQWWTACAKGNTSIKRIRLWKEKPPFYEYSGEERINASARIDHVSVPELEWFLPKKGHASTAVIFFPGGGYQYIGFLRNAKDLADKLDSSGIMVFGLKYRTGQDVKIPLSDAQRAVRYVRAYAKKWGIDPNRIGVAGQSAGANLVLNLAGSYSDGNSNSPDPVERESSRPDFMAVFNSWNFGSNTSSFTFKYDIPPVFFCHAKDDTAYKLAQHILAQLDAVNATKYTLIQETGGHGAFELHPSNPGSHWPSDFVCWLRKIHLYDDKLFTR